MAASKLQKFIRPAEIAGFIDAAKNAPSLREYSILYPIQDEHLRKVYLLILFFATDAFMVAGGDDNSLMSRAFQIATTISPNPLDAGEMKELMEQCLKPEGRNFNQFVQDLRHSNLTMPLLFHLFSMTNGETNNEIEKRLRQFAEKFDLSSTIQDVLNENTPQERTQIFYAKLNEQQHAQNDERVATIREKARRLEASLSDASPQKRYTDLFLFYKENGLQEDMLNYADALYRLNLQDSNLPEATQWLLQSIQLKNSYERRLQLLELYKMRCPSGRDPVEFAYQAMIADGIDGAREDYEAYKQQKRQQRTASSSSNNFAKKGCVIFILVMVAGVIGLFLPSPDGKQEKNESPKVEQQQQKPEQQQKKEDKPAVPQENPREASIKTFRAYHENLTKHDFQQAWACFDSEMQGYFNYDNWASGHQAMTKSNPYDIKVVSESPEKVVLSYTLQTVDNPGGEKMFDGKAVVVKTENGWKINDIENTLKQAEPPKPQQQTTPSAPPTTPPQPAPSAPSAPPSKPEIAYRTFTENWYGFSFEYPASEGDFPQADSKGGERAVEYWIDLPNNQGRVLMGTEFAWYDATEADMRYVADDKHSNDFEMLSTNSYIVRWNQGNETITRKTFMVPNRRKGSSGFVRQYIEIRQRGKLSPQNQEVAQHMMESFQPGE